MFTDFLEAPLIETSNPSASSRPIMLQPREWFAAPPAIRCSVCHLRELCMPRSDAESDSERLDHLVAGRRKVRSGQALYRQGERFEYIYAPRSGTFKASLSGPDGREQISGFYMAGEVLGLDGVASGSHASSAVALEDSEVCVIPYAYFSEIAANNAGLQQMISRLMSIEIVHTHHLMLLLGSMNVEERLAAFLLNLSRRFKARGYSSTEFYLRMTRAEIGSYLGMKLETVSRTFSLFQQQNLLEVDKRHVRITDMPRLSRVCEMSVH